MEPTSIEFKLLGPLEVTKDGALTPVTGTRQRALLAFLLLHRNHAVSRERLIDALWGEEPPATAANALQVAVHELRKLLGRRPPPRPPHRARTTQLRRGSAFRTDTG